MRESHMRSYVNTKMNEGDSNKICLMWREYEEQKARFKTTNSKQTRWSDYYSRHKNDPEDQTTCETLLLEIGKDSLTPDPSGAATQGYEGQQAVFTDSSLQSAERKDQPLLGPSFAPSSAFQSNWSPRTGNQYHEV